MINRSSWKQRRESIKNFHRNFGVGNLGNLYLQGAFTCLVASQAMRIDLDYLSVVCLGAAQHKVYKGNPPIPRGRFIKACRDRYGGTLSSKL